MNRNSGRILLIVAAAVLFLVPVAALGAGSFTDVPDSSLFKTDIEWLAATGVTKGCNPPANDRFCPDASVTRGQMAAFMHRLANGVVTAADSDKLDGNDAADFLGKDEYDADADGVVDSAAVMIRHASRSKELFDNNLNDNLLCSIHVTFDTPTTVVASGGLSMVPRGPSDAAFSGLVGYLRAGDVDLGSLSGSGSVVDAPEGGTSGAAVPITGTGTLEAGTYTFGIEPIGGEDIFPGPGVFDYDMSCDLVITAYTGLADAADYTYSG